MWVRKKKVLTETEKSLAKLLTREKRGIHCMTHEVRMLGEWCTSKSRYISLGHTIKQNSEDLNHSEIFYFFFDVKNRSVTWTGLLFLRMNKHFLCWYLTQWNLISMTLEGSRQINSWWLLFIYKYVKRVMLVIVLSYYCIVINCENVSNERIPTPYWYCYLICKFMFTSITRKN